MSDGSTYPRQSKVTLEIALSHAVQMFRGQAADYRNPHGARARQMDKTVRKNMAATLDEKARVIEAHLTALSTPSTLAEIATLNEEESSPRSDEREIAP